jgi:hypothetical protein
LACAQSDLRVTFVDAELDKTACPNPGPHTARSL